MALSTMKAVKFFYNDGVVKLVDVPKPKPAPGQVVIKVAHAGVCGSDIHAIKKDQKVADGDTIFGHEISGVVHDIGEGVSTVEKGERVAIDPIPSCGECILCQQGHLVHCPNLGLNAIIGYAKPGGWAQYTEVPESQIWTLSDDIPFSVGCQLEPLATLVRAFDDHVSFSSDAKILVMGAGFLGVLFAELLHFHGFRDVTITQRSEQRQKIAKNLGRGYNVCHPDVIRAELEGKDKSYEGYDMIIDMCGNPEAITEAITWLRRKGKLLLYAITPEGHSIKFDPFFVMQKEISIVSSSCGCGSFNRALQVMKNMRQNGYLDLDKMGAKVFKMEDYNDALKIVMEKHVSKVIFEVST